MRRVGRVAPEAQPLAQAMAVLGDGSRLASAAELAEIDDAEAGRISHTLRRIEILADQTRYAVLQQHSPDPPAQRNDVINL